MKKRILSFLLAICVILPILPTVAWATTYEPITDRADTTGFIINGNSVNRTTSPANSKDSCHTYEHDIYKAIWGKNFVSAHSNGDNMLKNLSATEREITVEHLKDYIGNAPLGSAIRIAPTAKQYEDNNYYGHSMILVAKTETGFTTLEGGLGGSEHRATRIYTWDNFKSHWSTYGSLKYINYIIWPHDIVSAETNLSPYFVCNVRIACFNGQTVPL